jgi:hypothetical protein
MPVCLERRELVQAIGRHLEGWGSLRAFWTVIVKDSLATFFSQPIYVEEVEERVLDCVVVARWS